MEERLGEMRKHCFFKSSAYDKLELKHQNLVFSSYGVKQNAKRCAIGEQNVIN